MVKSGSLRDCCKIGTAHFASAPKVSRAAAAERRTSGSLCFSDFNRTAMVSPRASPRMISPWRVESMQCHGSVSQGFEGIRRAFLTIEGGILRPFLSQKKSLRSDARTEALVAEADDPSCVFRH